MIPLQICSLLALPLRFSCYLLRNFPMLQICYCLFWAVPLEEYLSIVLPGAVNFCTYSELVGFRPANEGAAPLETLGNF